MTKIIMAFAPLVFLIVYALKTRKMADAMILATLLAMVLLHRQHFLTGAIDALHGALSNSSYQFVLCITIGFGGMITLFQESGALMGFRDLLLAVGAFPKAGVLKRAYRRVESGGPAFERDEKAEKLVDVADVDESRTSSAWNAVVPLAFLLVGATVFAVGGCWMVMTIAIPVFVPLALSMGVTAPVIIAAVMSGIGLGYSTCFYADAVFMTTAGTGVSNITIIKATLPYAAGRRRWLRRGFCCAGYWRERACGALPAGSAPSHSLRSLNLAGGGGYAIIKHLYKKGGIAHLWILTAVTTPMTT